MKMKKKQIVDTIIAIILILTGSLLLVLPNFDFFQIKWLFSGVMITYAIMNLIKFIITKEAKDYEGLFTSLVSLIIGVVSFVYKLYETPMNLAVSLFIWIAFMSLIKLKKADYYHDRNNFMWLPRLILMILFIVIGLLTSINLYYNEEIQTIILGYFFFINGILDLMDPIMNHLIRGKI